VFSFVGSTRICPKTQPYVPEWFVMNSLLSLTFRQTLPLSSLR
jgi:hypothetical protein